MKNLLAVVTVLALSMSYTNASDAECEYQSNVKSAYEQKVDKVDIINRRVVKYPIEGNFRQCILKLRMTIGGSTHPLTESYVFGPDMTENQACELAVFKGVETIQRAHSKRVFKVEQKYNCVLNKKQKGSIFKTAKKKEQRIWIQGRIFDGWKYQY